MFKKKSNLPPRPKCPTISQVIEDLAVVTKDDPIFVTAKTIYSQNEEDLDVPDGTAYSKIKNFFESNENLLGVMKDLNAMNNSLNEKQCDVNKMSDDLKNQAIKALIL